MATAKTTLTDEDAPIEALSAEDFLAGGEPKSRVVRLPEFGGKAVRVRALTGGEQDQLAKMTSTTINTRTDEARINTEQVRAKVLTWCVLDVHSHQPLFKSGDIFRLQAKDATIISRLYAVVQELSNVKQEEVDAIVEAFPAAPDDASSTASPRSPGASTS